MAPIIDFVPEVKVSEYDDLTNTELAALLEAGDNKATTFDVPTKDANKVRIEFARKANAAGKTARVQSVSNDGKTDKEGNPNGKTTFVFTLVERHKPRRGATEVTAEDNAEVEAAK